MNPTHIRAKQNQGSSPSRTVLISWKCRVPTTHNGYCISAVIIAEKENVSGPGAVALRWKKCWSHTILALEKPKSLTGYHWSLLWFTQKLLLCFPVLFSRIITQSGHFPHCSLVITYKLKGFLMSMFCLSWSGWYTCPQPGLNKLCLSWTFTLFTVFVRNLCCHNYSAKVLHVVHF